METNKDNADLAQKNKAKKVESNYKPVSINLKEDWDNRIKAIKGDMSRHKWIRIAVEEKLAKKEDPKSKLLKTFFRRSDGSFDIK